MSHEPDTGLQVGNMNMGMPVVRDAHIIINNVAGMGKGTVGIEDGIVSLEPSDDFAMGAPPVAPGAVDGDEGSEGETEWW